MDFHVGPEHFREPGAPLGGAQCTVAVGGHSVRFSGLSPELHEAVLSRYALFLSEIPPLHTVTLCAGAPAYLAPAPDGYLRLEETQRGEGRILLSTGMAGFWPSGGRDGLLRLSQPGNARFALMFLENYLRWVIADLALERGGFVLHCAGLVRGGKAYLFFGPSGAGKTTVAGLSGDHILLSDDLVLLTRGADGWRASTTPFWGALAQELKDLGTYPLAGLYRLIQAPQHALRPVSGALAVGMVAACCPFVSDPAQRHDKLLPLVEECSRSVGVQELRFKKDPGFWDLIA